MCWPAKKQAGQLGLAGFKKVCLSKLGLEMVWPALVASFKTAGLFYNDLGWKLVYNIYTHNNNIHT